MNNSDPTAPRSGPFAVTLADLLMALIVAFALLKDGQGLFGSDDIGWHLLVGRRVLATWAVPRVDWLTFTHSGHPFMAWEWLWDAVAAWIEGIAGLPGLAWATALLAGLTFRLVARDLSARGDSPLVATLVTFLVAHAAWIHAFVRPHVLSWLLTWVTWRMLNLREMTRRDSAVLTCVYVVWANLHPGFLLGLVLVATHAAGAALEGHATDARRAAWLLVLLLAASMVNPWGPGLHAHAVAAAVGRHNAYTVEFLPPALLGSARGFGMLLALSLAAPALLGPRPAARAWVPAAVFCALALRSARVIPLAAMLLGPILSASISGLLDRARTPLGKILARCAAVTRAAEGRVGFTVWPLVIGLVAAAALRVNAGTGRIAIGFPRVLYPVDATSRLLSEHPGRVFADAAWGGYLAWRQGSALVPPRFPVFIDNRFDMHGPERVEEFLAIDGAKPGWQKSLDGYTVRYILVRSKAPLVRAASAAGWRTVYGDSLAVLLERTPP